MADRAGQFVRGLAAGGVDDAQSLPDLHNVKADVVAPAVVAFLTGPTLTSGN